MQNKKHYRYCVCIFFRATETFFWKLINSKVEIINAAVWSLQAYCSYKIWICYFSFYNKYRHVRQRRWQRVGKYIREYICMQKRKDEVINMKESGGEHDPAVLISRCARLSSKKLRENPTIRLFSNLNSPLV